MVFPSPFPSRFVYHIDHAHRVRFSTRMIKLYNMSLVRYAPLIDAVSMTLPFCPCLGTVDVKERINCNRSSAMLGDLDTRPRQQDLSFLLICVLNRVSGNVSITIMFISHLVVQ